MKQIKTVFFDKLSILVISAFGFVAALAWNETIKAIFTRFYGNPNELIPMLIYAVIVTFIAVIVTMIISQISKHNIK